MDERETQILHSWQENASAWTASIRTEQIGSRKLVTNKAIIDAVLKHSPNQVLDLGCGEGWLTRELTQHGMSVVGVDGSAPLIEKAKDLGGGTFYVVAYEDIAEAEVISQLRFDAVVCNFALVGEAIGELLNSLRHLLDEQGKLLIKTLHPFAACGDEAYKDGWRVETFASFGAAYRQPMPWYFRTIGSWVDVLEKAELSIAALEEPIHPATGKPLSLLITCTK